MEIDKNVIKDLKKERDYWKQQAEFRLKIIADLEEQLRKHDIEPKSETRFKEHGVW